MAPLPTGSRGFNKKCKCFYRGTVHLVSTWKWLKLKFFYQSFQFTVLDLWLSIGLVFLRQFPDPNSIVIDLQKRHL